MYEPTENRFDNSFSFRLMVTQGNIRWVFVIGLFVIPIAVAFRIGMAGGDTPASSFFGLLCGLALLPL